MKIIHKGDFHGHIIATKTVDDVVYAVTSRPKGSSVPTHSHDYAAFLSLIEGQHHYTTDDGKIRWSIPNVWYFGKPFVPHTHDACSTDILSVGIQIDPTAYPQLADTLSTARVTGDRALFTSNLILNELTKKKTPSPDTLRGILHLVLGEFLDGQSTLSSPSDWPEWLTNSKTELDNNFLNFESVTAISSHFGVHPSHLARVFKDKLGQTVTDYVRDRRLEWAYDKIQTTDKKVGAIAIESGFADHAHFCRMFKRRYGRSPSELRP